MGLADDLGDVMMDAAIDGCRQAAERILVEARRNAPPEGAPGDPNPAVSLTDPAHSFIEKDGPGWHVVFSTPYAAKQHEDRHLQHPRGGGPKYLEKALMSEIPSIDRIVANRVAARMRYGAESHRRQGGAQTRFVG